MPPMDATDRDSKIKHYFMLGMSYDDILATLALDGQEGRREITAFAPRSHQRPGSPEKTSHTAALFFTRA